MEKEMYNIFAIATPKVQIKIHQLKSVDNATPGRQRAKSATDQRILLSDVTNKLPYDYFKCIQSPQSGCDRIPNKTLSQFSEVISSPSSQPSCKRVPSHVYSPLVNCQSPQANGKRILSNTRSPFNDLKICKSVQSSKKKIARYSGSPCNKFAIYSDNLDLQSDKASCCSLFDTFECSDFEDDVFINKSDEPYSDETEKNSNIQFYDSFENDDDEEGPWLPRRLFRDAEELHTLVRGYHQQKIDNCRISLSPIALPTRVSVELFTLNISCGPPPSPEAVEIDI